MKHYVYKTTDIITNQFYIGRHSTKKENDDYKGSGLWVLNHKFKKNLKLEILEYVKTFEDLKNLEEQYIEIFFEDELCMNRNKNSVGFASGSLNPNCSEFARKRNRERILGNKNPMYGRKHTQETKDKIAQGCAGIWLGRNHSQETKDKMSKAKKGYKLSLEHCKKLSIAKKGKLRGPNENAQVYKFYHEDGRIVIYKSLKRYAELNGYSASQLCNVKNNKLLYHKDIIRIEKVNE